MCETKMKKSHNLCMPFCNDGFYVDNGRIHSGILKQTLHNIHDQQAILSGS